MMSPWVNTEIDKFRVDFHNLISVIFRLKKVVSIELLY